ncbi:hypothetical protein [Streptomyces scopuliridis]|uniref:hypothetical protein n=1 Tax=Streptomyces scopuliridis TaxID=452529 RepID=UPI000AD811C1|nr:hypothetical protein [Streptomyces scopuliridis]
MDIDKRHHDAVVINGDGVRLLSCQLKDGESSLLTLIGDVLSDIRGCVAGLRSQPWWRRPGAWC